MPMNRMENRENGPTTEQTRSAFNQRTGGRTNE